MAHHDLHHEEGGRQAEHGDQATFFPAVPPHLGVAFGGLEKMLRSSLQPSLLHFFVFSSAAATVLPMQWLLEHTTAFKIR